MYRGPAPVVGTAGGEGSVERLEGFEARMGREMGAALGALRAWREAHPSATFAQIEDAVDAELDAARARVLAELALASRAADLSGQPEADRARCPGCGARLAPQGKKGRTVLTRGGRGVRLERDHARCPSCGAGLFPPGRGA
jgi:hypothetical protein